MIPSRAPMSGFGALPTSPRPGTGPRVNRSVPEYWQRAVEPGGSWDVCDLWRPVRDPRHACSKLYCREMGMADGERYLTRRFDGWVRACNCPYIRGPHCGAPSEPVLYAIPMPSYVFSRE